MGWLGPEVPGRRARVSARSMANRGSGSRSACWLPAMIGYQQWTAWQELQELEDLDAQILTSDLPIDAYLDRGFQLWLKTGKPDE